MKKGFTLIELLVVMVVVGILVTIGLPKYRVAIEKGRGLEGFSNAGAISDALNAYYIRNYNSYAQNTQFSGRSAVDFAGMTAEQTKNKFFNASVAVNGDTATVTLARKAEDVATGRGYSIIFVNTGGEVSERYCTGYDKYCKALGATTVRSSGGWSF